MLEDSHSELQAIRVFVLYLTDTVNFPAGYWHGPSWLWLMFVWLHETLQPNTIGWDTPPAHLRMKFVHQICAPFREEKKKSNKPLDCCGFLYSVYSWSGTYSMQDKIITVPGKECNLY